MLTPHLKAGLEKMFGALFNFLQFSGKTVATIIYAFAVTVFGFVFRMAASVFGFLGHWLVNKFKQPLLEALCFVLTPVAHAIGALAHTTPSQRTTPSRNIRDGTPPSRQSPQPDRNAGGPTATLR